MNVSEALRRAAPGLIPKPCEQTETQANTLEKHAPAFCSQHALWGGWGQRGFVYCEIASAQRLTQLTPSAFVMSCLDVTPG